MLRYTTVIITIARFLVLPTWYIPYLCASKLNGCLNRLTLADYWQLVGIVVIFGSGVLADYLFVVHPKYTSARFLPLCLIQLFEAPYWLYFIEIMAGFGQGLAYLYVHHMKDKPNNNHGDPVKDLAQRLAERHRLVLWEEERGWTASLKKIRRKMASLFGDAGEFRQKYGKPIRESRGLAKRREYLDEIFGHLVDAPLPANGNEEINEDVN